MGFKHFTKQIVEALRATDLSQAGFNLLRRRHGRVSFVFADGAGSGKA
jgi:hypothetical protein